MSQPFWIIKIGSLPCPSHKHPKTYEMSSYMLAKRGYPWIFSGGREGKAAYFSTF
jgi:hypothetical protein